LNNVRRLEPKVDMTSKIVLKSNNVKVRKKENDNVVKITILSFILIGDF